MTTQFLILADTHINSTVGLVKPGIQLDDGGSYQPSKSQRWLYNSFLDYCDKAPDPMAEKCIGILNGDILEADTKHRSRQVITRNKANIIEMAFETLEPFLIICDEVYLVRGTPPHVGMSGELEELLANDITIAVKDGKRASWWYFERECEGIRLFAAHHTSGGRLPWTFANAANRNAAEVEFVYGRLKKKPPDVLFYSHLHLFANSGKYNYPTQVFHTPGFQMPTGYANKKPLSLADVGAMSLKVSDGDYEFKLYRYLDGRNKAWVKM